jgi:hypothetical protein
VCTVVQLCRRLIKVKRDKGNMKKHKGGGGGGGGGGRGAVKRDAG